MPESAWVGAGLVHVINVTTSCLTALSINTWQRAEEPGKRTWCWCRSILTGTGRRDIKTKPFGEESEINTSCENVAYFGTFNECFARTWEAAEQGERREKIQLYLQWSIVIIIIINIMIIVLDSLLQLGMGADSNRDCLSVSLSPSPSLSLFRSVYPFDLLSFAITIIFYLPELTQETRFPAPHLK